MNRPFSHTLAVITASMYFMILAGCGGGDSGPTSPTPSTPDPPAPPPTPVATSITVTPSSDTLASIGATVQLTATVRDQNNIPMTGQTVTWTSANTAVATVSGNGLVTAVANGTSQITARSGNASGTANITVAEPVPTRIAVTPSSHTLEAIGETVELRATVRDQRNNVMSGQSITWSSGDEAVATVSEAGLVTAVSNGKADITAKSGSLSFNAAITVEQVPATIVITVDPDATTLTEIDQTLQLTATVSDANDVAIEDAAVSWSSSDESVATVDEDGLVTAVGNGMADITAAAGEASGMVGISVMGPNLDRETLMAIYNATYGQFWYRKANWLSEAPISTWYGITTNDGGRVTKIEFGENGMAGSLPAELGQLTYLDSLIVRNNNLTGPIPPELARLERLEYLNLELTSLTGPIPPELARLERLEYLNLGGNDLTGPIPPELGQLERLEYLYLSGNGLTGPIPPELGQLERLEYLNLGGLQLTGPIPPELGQLASLELLYLYSNELSGTIPSELGQLTNLEHFFLNENNLTGNIPPEIGQITDLQALDLSVNELSGSLPVELGQLQHLKWLNLENNTDISGSLPDSFPDLEDFQFLGLSGTRICVPPTDEFRTWLSGISHPGLGPLNLEDITFCETEYLYLPWTGVKVERGKLLFSASLGEIDLTDCFTKNVLIGAVAPFPPEGLKDWNAPTGETLTVHYSLWQRSDDMGSTWTNIETTRVMYDACPYDPEVAGEYRLVGDITINDDRSFRRSENTFVVP